MFKNTFMALFLLEIMIQVELYPTENDLEGQKKSKTNINEVSPLSENRKKKEELTQLLLYYTFHVLFFKLKKANE